MNRRGESRKLKGVKRKTESEEVSGENERKEEKKNNE